jgi:RimJ/RimL family protein N-acetyltransferase
MSLLQERPDEVREASTPVLETERLMLRTPRLEDAKTVAALCNDRRIAENTKRIPHPYRLADAEAWIGGGRRRGERNFLITSDGAIIGACGLEVREEEEPELGYWLAVPHWGKGFGTEAVRALIDHAFDALGHEAIQAGARVSNPASRRLLEKCGFQWTGVGLYRIHAINSSAPVDRFRLERRIWSSLKDWGRASARCVA